MELVARVTITVIFTVMVSFRVRVRLRLALFLDIFMENNESSILSSVKITEDNTLHTKSNTEPSANHNTTQTYSFFA